MGHREPTALCAAPDRARPEATHGGVVKVALKCVRGHSGQGDQRRNKKWHALPGCLDDYLVEILGRINKNIDHGLSSSLLGFVAYLQQYGV